MANQIIDQPETIQFPLKGMEKGEEEKDWGGRVFGWILIFLIFKDMNVRQPCIIVKNMHPVLQSSPVNPTHKLIMPSTRPLLEIFLRPWAFEPLNFSLQCSFSLYHFKQHPLLSDIKSLSLSFWLRQGCFLQICFFQANLKFNLFSIIQRIM